MARLSKQRARGKKNARCNPVRTCSQHIRPKYSLVQREVQMSRSHLLCLGVGRAGPAGGKTWPFNPERANSRKEGANGGAIYDSVAWDVENNGYITNKFESLSQDII